MITDHDYLLFQSCGDIRFLLSYPYIIMSNFFTKLASSVGIVTLVAASTSVSLVSAASEFLAYAEMLADNGVINSNTEAGYRLSSNITRAELAKVVANLGGIDSSSCTGDVYSDVGAAQGDLCGYIEALADAGVVSTASATFRPTASVTRAEMVKMILGALGETGSEADAGYMDLSSMGDLAGYVNRANELGCAADNDYFRPNATASRGEAFKIAACAAGLELPVVPPTGTGTTSTGTVSTGTVMGALTASLEGTAMAQYVPKNASSVKVGTVKLMAGASDVTVRSLAVTRSGLGNSADIASNNGIRAAQNGVIVSSTSDFYNSTSQVGTVYFYPALVVKAGSSQMIDVLVNLSGAENSQHQFTLTAVSADNTTVTGAPVTLGLLNTTSYVTANVTLGGTNYGYSVNPGKTQQTIAKVDLTSGSRDVTVNGFTLTRSGSNDLTKKFANVKIYKNGVAVGTATLTADKLSVMGLATPLAAGNFQSFEIKADALVDGSSGGNVLQFKVEASSDVSALEVATGYATQTVGVGVSGTTVSTVTFNAVDVTYTKQSSANQTVAPGASNVTLFDGKITSTVALSVRQLVITPQGGAISGALSFANDQLTVKVNGSEVATITATDFPSGSTTAINKTVSIPVDAATAGRITIVGSSVKNTIAGSSNYTFSVKLADVRDAANNSVALLTDTITGDKTTIQAPTLTLKNATVAAPTNDKISSTTNQEIGRFGLTAEGDAVRVTKVVLGSVGAALTGVVDASSIELRDAATDVKLAGTVTLSGNVIVVDSMNNDVLKDVTQNIKVVFTSVKSLDNYYGQTLQLTVSTGGLTVTNVNGGSAVTLVGTSTMKTYTIGVVPPTVLVTGVTLAQNAKIATLRVTNPDSNTGITLNTITTTFQARSTAQGGFTFSGAICLRDVGSNASCGSAGTSTGITTSQAGGTYVFNIPASMLANNTTTLTKNGGNVEFEVYLENAPLWVAGDNANVTVTAVNYTAGSAVTQSYVGVAGASATSTKN
jgi:hypothetical protein